MAENFAAADALEEIARSIHYLMRQSHGPLETTVLLTGTAAMAPENPGRLRSAI